jgi:hypothetical protein
MAKDNTVKKPLELYNFPTYDITIEAESIEDAQDKLQKLLSIK